MQEDAKYTNAKRIDSPLLSASLQARWTALHLSSIAQTSADAAGPSFGIEPKCQPSVNVCCNGVGRCLRLHGTEARNPAKNGRAKDARVC